MRDRLEPDQEDLVDVAQVTDDLRRGPVLPVGPTRQHHIAVATDRRCEFVGVRAIRARRSSRRLFRVFLSVVMTVLLSVEGASQLLEMIVVRATQSARRRP
jgi:hypothetical protein